MTATAEQMLNDPGIVRYGIYKQNQYIYELDQHRDRMAAARYNEILKSALLVKMRLKSRLKVLIDMGLETTTA